MVKKAKRISKKDKEKQKRAKVNKTIVRMFDIFAAGLVAEALILVMAVFSGISVYTMFGIMIFILCCAKIVVDIKYSK